MEENKPEIILPIEESMSTTNWKIAEIKDAIALKI